MKKKTRYAVITAILLLTGIVVACGGGQMGFYETPEYTAEKRGGNIEIRTYPPLLVAEVTSQGDRQAGVSSAVRELADFIFGNNAPQSKISMTTPVIQESGAKIAMTTPVVQETAGNGWTTRFVMPKQYTLASLPKPNNPNIKIYETAAKRYAVIRFTWSTTNANVSKHEKLLRDFVVANAIKTKPQAIYAYYDPPWTLPFFRRNEVMLELEE